jgi:phage tail tube protein FII
LKYRFEGREKRLSFGAYPTVSLAEARDARVRANSLLAKEIDPGAAKQAEGKVHKASAEHTYGKMADAFLEKG